MTNVPIEAGDAVAEARKEAFAAVWYGGNPSAHGAKLDAYEAAIVSRERERHVSAVSAALEVAGEAQEALARERERARALVEALRHMLDSWEAVKPEVTSLTMLAYAHGHRYEGPTMVAALAEAEATLAAYEEQNVVS